MTLRDYVAGTGALSPLRRSLRAVAPFRAVLRKSQRRTHHLEQWDYWDYDDPGEAEGRLADEWAIIDQEAEEGRAHHPGYHNRRYRRQTVGYATAEPPEPPHRRVAKSDRARWLNPDGTFKGGFDGAVRYFEAHGYDHDTAVKIAGQIAARKRLHQGGHPKAPPRHGDLGEPPASRRLPPGAHRTPPKGYPTDRRQYAIPAWYALPLDTPAHARNAASRFPQMREYPHLSPEQRRKVWRRIVAAERRFGIEPGPDVLAAAGLRRPKG